MRKIPAWSIVALPLVLSCSVAANSVRAAANPAPLRSALPELFLQQRGTANQLPGFVLPARNGALFFHAGGVTFRFHDGTVREAELEFLDADRAVFPVGEELSPTRVTWFGGDTGSGATKLSAFTRVVYRDLKPGIDLVFGGDRNRLAAQFVARPGAASALPRLVWKGTPPAGYGAEIRPERNRPAMRHAVSRARQTVSAGESMEIFYCGYLPGGGAYEYGGGIAVDGSGCAYVTGNTYLQDIYYSPPVQTSFLAKVSADGRALEYLALFGAGITVNDVAVDPAGCAHITGEASGAAALPFAVGPDLTFNGGDRDAFVAKLNPQGTDVVFCGLIGGDGAETAKAIALDRNGNLFVCGWTDSPATTFPVRAGPLLTYSASHGDAWIAEVQADGRGLLFCGYMGLESASQITGGEAADLVVNGSGDAYLCGSAWGDGRWAWWAKVRGATGNLLYYTFGEDYAGYGNGICVDAVGNVYTFDGFYVEKFTPDDTPHSVYRYRYLSTGYRFTSVAVDSAGRALLSSCRYENPPGTRRSTIVRLKADGSGPADSREFALDDSTQIRGIAVDARDCVYLVGETRETEETFPVRSGPGLLFDRSPGNVSDAFLVKLAPPVELTLLGVRRERKSWLAAQSYAELDLAIANSTGIAVSVYVLQRRSGSGPYTDIQEIQDAAVSGAFCRFLDAALPRGGSRTYRVEARDANGSPMARSNEVTL